MAKYTDPNEPKKPLFKGKYIGYTEARLPYNEVAINKRARERGIKIGKDPEKPLMRSVGQGFGLLPSGEIEGFGDTGDYTMTTKQMDDVIDSWLAPKNKLPDYQPGYRGFVPTPEGYRSPDPISRKLEEEGREVTLGTWYPGETEPALYDEIYKTEEIFTTGLKSDSLKQMLPYNEIPQQDPRWQSAFAITEAQKQSKLIKFAADQDKLMSQINDIQGDSTLTNKMMRDAQAILINKFKAKWIGKTVMPPTPAEIEKATVTPRERMETLAKRIIETRKAYDKAPAGSPEETAFYNEMYIARKELARAQGQDYLDVPTYRKGRNIKGVNNLIGSPEKIAQKARDIISKYKARGLDIPWQLQSYDIGRPAKPSEYPDAVWSDKYGMWTVVRNGRLKGVK